MIYQEKYLTPKEIAAALSERLNKTFSAAYVRAIRIVTVKRREPLFVAGVAKVGDVVAWLASNPDFRMNAVYRRKDFGDNDSFPVSKIGG